MVRKRVAEQAAIGQGSESPNEDEAADVMRAVMKQMTPAERARVKRESTQKDNPEPTAEDIKIGEKINSAFAGLDADEVEWFVRRVIMNTRQQRQKSPEDNKLTKTSKRFSKAQVLNYSNALIQALSDALEYDHTRHHNEPPPALRLDGDPEYLKEVKRLIDESYRFNNLLEKSLSSKDSDKAVFKLSEHLNVFMKNFVPVMGKGTAGLLLATGAGLLIHAGMPEASVGGLWALLRR
jgi:hypothetical protein